MKPLGLIKQKTIDFKSYVDIIDEVMACGSPDIKSGFHYSMVRIDK
jgi:hypothetical protein